jgi:hypothetical protein
MAMNRHGRNDQIEGAVSAHAKRTRLQALLFAGAALGTALVTLGGAETKLPPYHGE